MAHYGTLRDYKFRDRDADDVRGSSIYGRDDEKLGKIDDVIFDHSTGEIRYVVVDTGGWLSSKKFLVPTNRICQSRRHKDDFEANLSKTQVETFPPYNENDIQSEDRWRNYEERYKDAWKDDPVQHREGTDRNITPTAEELPPAPAGKVDYDPNVVNRRIVPPTANEVNIPVSGAGVGDRWSRFEDLMRQRREDVTAVCAACGRKASSPDDIVSERRKVG